MKAILIISCFFAVAMAAPAAHERRTLKEELLSLLRKELLEDKEDSEPTGVRVFTTSGFFFKSNILEINIWFKPNPNRGKDIHHFFFGSRIQVEQSKTLQCRCKTFHTEHKIQLIHQNIRHKTFTLDRVCTKFVESQADVSSLHIFTQKGI